MRSRSNFLGAPMFLTMLIFFCWLASSQQAEAAAPTVSTPISDVNVDEDASATSIDLKNNFSGADSYSVFSNTDTSLVTTQFSPNAHTLKLSYTANASGTASITVRASKGDDSIDDTFTVTVTPVNDPPVAVGDSATTTENSSVATDVIANDTDPDSDDGVAELSLVASGTGAPAIVSATVGGDAITIADESLSLLISGNQITFDPLQDFDLLQAGESATVEISYTVKDTLQAGESGMVETSAGILTITVDGENDAPVFAAFGGEDSGSTVINQYSMKTNRSLRPFADLEIEDLDADSLTVSVTLTGLGGGGVSGHFEHPDPSISLVNGSFTLSDDDPATLSDAVSVALQSLEYYSQTEALASSQELEICFEIEVEDELTSDVINCTDPPATPDLSKRVMVEGTPLIVGTSSDQVVNDSETIAPFSTVEIQNPAGGDVEIVITMNDDNLGLLEATANFQVTSESPNTLTFSGGNAEAATSAIRQLLFNPADNQLASVGDARFTIVLNSTATPPGNELDSNDETLVTVVPTNDAPDIVGTSDARTNDATPIKPFGSVSIIDVDEAGAQRVTLRIRMEDPEQGSLVSTHPIAGGGIINKFAGTSNTSPITVYSPAHGLATGDLVRIFGYGGNSSYNSTHEVTVAGDTDTFTIPIDFVDDDPDSGFWLKLIPAIDYTGTDAAAPLTVVSAEPHGLSAGDEITISGYGGPTPNDYNQVHTVASVPDLDEFEVDVDFQDISTESPAPPLGGWFAGTISDVDGAYNSLLALGNGTLLISGTPEEVTEVIRDLQFIPQQNRQPVGGNETVAITIGVNDGNQTRTSRVEVIVDSINGAPIVTVPGDQPTGVIDEEPIRPFGPANADIRIDDEGDDELTVKVTPDDPEKGSFFAPSLMLVSDPDPAEFPGSPVAIEGYEEGAGGMLRILSTGHGLSSGDLLSIGGYEGGGAYNGGQVVTVADTDWFEVAVGFEDDATPRGEWSSILVEIEGYAAGPGGDLRVTSTAHGLDPGDLVGISGYGGEGFYNGVHQINDAGTDWFDIPANFKDDDASKGTWVELTASGEEFEFVGSPSLATAVLQSLIFELNGEYPFTPDNPGGTTFTIEASDSLNNTDIETLAITLIIEPTTWIVTTTDNDGAGSLREAIVDLAGPNDHIVFGLGIPMGDPLAITLESEIVIGKHLTIHGPGANKLIITGNGSSRLFTVNSFTTIRGLTLQGGNAPTFGGAIAVETFGNLHLLDCTLRRNRSAQWGGAVDVGGVFGGGSLTVERCLFLENATDQTLGRGGGAISLYTNQACTIINTTFSANEQRASNGTGGGAIYVQAAESGLEFPLFVVNSTFAENDDASDQGSSIHSRSFNTSVWVKNNIFADDRGKNLEVAVAGNIRSLGGNISDDPTTTVFTQNGVPRLIQLLDESIDLLDQSTDNIGLLPLANNKGSSPTYLLENTSVALGHAVTNPPDSPIVLAAIAAATANGVTLSEDELDALPLALEPGTDQRGIWRDWAGAVDSGALQTGGFKSLIINEIAFDPTGGESSEFVEFYNPRSSEPIAPGDVEDFALLTSGGVRHEFTPLVLDPTFSNLDPGLGFVVAASSSVTVPGDPNATPPIPEVPLQIASSGSLSLDNRRDTVILKNDVGQVLEWVSYVGNFATGGILNSAYLDPLAPQSIVQSPEFMGGFLPHKLAMVLKTGQNPTTTDIQGFAPSSPGKDLISVPLSGGNAPPIAISDRIELTEDSPLSLPVLDNDIEFDRIDEIRVTALGNTIPTVDGTTPITTSPNGVGLGAVVTIIDGGLAIEYDPLDPALSFSLQELMEGELLVDQFYYTIIDRDSVSKTDYPQDSDNRTLATTLVTLEVSGVNDVPEPQDRNYAAMEDEPIRILVDDTLIGAPFDFEDDPAKPVTLMTSAALLPQADDYDIDKDDDNGTLRVSAVSAVGAPEGSEDLTTLSTISSCGATVVLDFRFKREESSIVYDPSSSETLNRLAFGETVTDTFQYSLLDRHGAVQVATVSILITGVNDGPMANDDDLGLATNEDTTLEIDAQILLANDTDPDTDFGHQGGANAQPDVPGTDLGDVLQIQGVIGIESALGAAIAWDSQANKVVYMPQTSETLQSLARGELLIEPAEDSFEYTMVDEKGVTSTAMVRLTVIGVNDTPTAVDDTVDNTGYDTFEDVLLNVPAEIGLLANDLEIDINGFAPDDLLRVEPNTTFTTLADGIVTIQQDGGFSFDPRESSIFDAIGESYTLVDTFDYTIIDNSLTQAIDDVFSVETDTGNHRLPVLANDRAMPYPGAELVIIEDSLTAPDKGGSVILNGDGTELVYTPLTNFVGVDTFNYAISDGLGGTDTATVRVNVIEEALNGNLIANDDKFTMGMGTSAELRVLTNDHVLPESGESLFITGVGGDEVAHVTISADQKSLIYAPDPNDVGEKTFSYSVSAGGISEPTATVSVRLVDRARELNLDLHPDGNSIFDDSFSVAESSADNALPVLANDFILPGAGGQLFVVGVGEIGDDPYSPGAPLPTSIVTASNGSTVAINEEGDGLIYTPGSDFRGDESFRYQFTDGAGGTGDAVVHVTVVGDFQPNVDRFRVLGDSGQVELDVLLNDSILGGEEETLTLDQVGGGADDPNNGGTAITSGSDTVLYEPAASFTGEEIFRYRVMDGTGAIATGTVIVEVVSSGAGLNPVKDAFSVASGSEEMPLAVMANDAVFPGGTGAAFVSKVGPADDDPRTFTTSNGSTVSLNETSDGLLYTPAEGFSGDESFIYTLEDGTGLAASANVTVFIPGSRLIAGDNRYAVATGSVDNGLDVLLNDVIIPDEGQTRVITGVGLDSDAPEAAGLDPNAAGISGTVQINGAADKLFYTPDSSTASERFKYEISEGTLARAEGEVMILIPDRAGVLEPNDDVFSVEQGSEGNTLLVLANDLIVPGTGESWSIIPLVSSPETSSGGGEFRVNSTRDAIVYTPATDFIGTDTLAYEVSDGLGGTGIASVSVKVGDLPTNADSFVVLADSVDNQLVVLTNDEILPASAEGFTLLRAFHLDSGGARVNDQSSLGGTLVVEMDADLDGDGVGDEDVIIYTPPPNTPPADIPPNSDKTTAIAIDSFTYEVVDDTGDTVEGHAVVSIFEAGSDRDDATVSVTLIGVNDAPTIDSSGAVYMVIDDKGVGSPFQGVILTEVDEQGNQIIKVLATIDDPDSGVLTNLGGFVEVAPGVYEFVGTAADATIALQGLIFVPVENWVMVSAPPVAEDFGFALSIMDNDPDVASPLTTTDTSVEIGVTAVNDPPTLVGAIPGQSVYYKGSIKAFAGVVVTEVDDHEHQELTVDVALDDPTHGILASPSGAFVDQGGGVYRFIGTAAAANAALGELEFDPTTGDRLQAGLNPADSETTQFTITVDDQFGGIATDASTTVTAIHGFIAEIASTDGTSNDNMGWSVGASSDFVVAGAPNEDDNGNSSGAAYVFAPVNAAKDEWQESAKLVPNDGAGGDQFGASADVDGEFIIIGAPNEKTQGISSGAAYVFGLEAGSWVQVAKLVPSDGANSDEFGISVAISGDLIVVGSHLDDDGETGSGAVYVYENQGGSWTEISKLTSLLPIGGQQLGHSVDVSGETIIAGAPFSTPNGVQTGSAYIFERATPTTWDEVAQLVGSDAVVNGQLGKSVGIDGDTAVAGAPLHDEDGTKTGAAFLFERDAGWDPVEVAKLLPPAGENTDEFGFSVDISGDDVVVGMHNDSNPVLNQSKFGSSYIFNRDETGADQWGLLETILSLTPDNNDELGFSVAIGGHTVAIGIPFDNPAGTGDAGGIIIYRLKYNNGPVSRLPIDEQIAEVSQSFQFAIPAGAFGDPDEWESLSYSATSSGGPLPGWLSLDPATGIFTGTPGAGDLGAEYLIDLTVTDEDGLAAQASFTIAVLPPQAVTSGGLPDEVVLLSQPSLAIASESGSEFVELRFLGLTSAANGAEMDYSIEMSTDLTRWEPASGELSEGSEATGDTNVRAHIWRSDQPLTSLPARYFRVRIKESVAGEED